MEGALERVVEEADRVLTSISNTNNAFHMLANTQFIENRTYQDDADVAKREKPEPKEKVNSGHNFYSFRGTVRCLDSEQYHMYSL